MIFNNTRSLVLLFLTHPPYVNEERFTSVRVHLSYFMFSFPLPEVFVTYCNNRSLCYDIFSSSNIHFPRAKYVDSLCNIELKYEGGPYTSWNGCCVIPQSVAKVSGPSSSEYTVDWVNWAKEWRLRTNKSKLDYELMLESACSKRYKDVIWPPMEWVVYLSCAYLAAGL